MDESEIRLRATRAGMHEAVERLADAIRFARANGLTIAEIGRTLGVSEAEVYGMGESDGLDGAGFSHSALVDNSFPLPADALDRRIRRARRRVG